jgi:hypothetical protein
LYRVSSLVRCFRTFQLGHTAIIHFLSWRLILRRNCCLWFCLVKGHEITPQRDSSVSTLSVCTRFSSARVVWHAQFQNARLWPAICCFMRLLIYPPSEMNWTVEGHFNVLDNDWGKMWKEAAIAVLRCVCLNIICLRLDWGWRSRLALPAAQSVPHTKECQHLTREVPLIRTALLQSGLTRHLTEISSRSRKKMILGSKVRPVRKADNFAAIFEPIVYIMWDR